MSKNEKRILVLEVNPDCRALRFDCDPLDPDGGMFCDKSGRYVRITEKDCAKCKSPIFAGITRAEAVERMAKAMYVDNWKRRTPLVRVTNWEKGFADNMKKKYILAAEAALDAILGTEMKNAK